MSFCSLRFLTSRMERTRTRKAGSTRMSLTSSAVLEDAPQRARVEVVLAQVLVDLHVAPHLAAAVNGAVGVVELRRPHARQVEVAERAGGLAHEVAERAGGGGEVQERGDGQVWERLAQEDRVGQEIEQGGPRRLDFAAIGSGARVLLLDAPGVHHMQRPAATDEWSPR
ncbi:hypothetical protein DL769_011559 [Monosporascus sp. CRB-8-3]|nr:hypothetical protein DL769_011559 [Monosporascus sp. CRB-8-3]